MTETLSEQLADYRASWRARVPADKQTLMDQYVAHLAATGTDRAREAGCDARGHSPVRPAWRDFRYRGLAGQRAHNRHFLSRRCPFCNLELRAYQAVLPRIAAAGASLVAISPEKPDDTVSTAEKNALSFPVLSDVGHATGKAFGVVYAFTDDVRQVYEGLKLEIPAKNGTPGDW